jgi:hypothetical protein
VYGIGTVIMAPLKRERQYCYCVILCIDWWSCAGNKIANIEHQSNVQKEDRKAGDGRVMHGWILLLQAQAKAEKEKAAKVEAALSAARTAAAADAAAASTAQAPPKKKPGAQKAMLKGARMAFSNNTAAAQPSKITFSKVSTSSARYKIIYV